MSAVAAVAFFSVVVLVIAHLDVDNRTFLACLSSSTVPFHTSGVGFLFFVVFVVGLDGRRTERVLLPLPPFVGFAMQLSSGLVKRTVFVLLATAARTGGKWGRLAGDTICKEISTSSVIVASSLRCLCSLFVLGVERVGPGLRLLVAGVGDVEGCIVAG